MNNGLLGIPRITPLSNSLEAPLLRPSLQSTFTIVREDVNCTIRDFAGGVRITAQGTNSNTNNLRYAAHWFTPGSDGWRFTAKIRKHYGSLLWAMCGIMLRNSSTGKSKLFSMGRDSQNGLNAHNFAGDTAFAAVGGISEYYEYSVWLRIQVTGGLLQYLFSLDGKVWTLCASESNASSYEPNPNQCGFYFNPNFGGSGAGSAQLRDQHVDCLSWQFEQL